MNKIVLLIIGLALIVGIVFGLRAIYKQPTPEPTSAPVVFPTSTPTSTSRDVLDRIEAAIKEKLKR